MAPIDQIRRAHRAVLEKSNEAKKRLIERSTEARSRIIETSAAAKKRILETSAAATVSLKETGIAALNHPSVANNRIVGAGISAATHPMVTSNDFIRRDLKFRFIFRFCLLTLVGGAFFTAVILYSCRGTLTTSFESGRLVLQKTSLAVFPGVIYTNLIMLGLATVLIVALTFFLSHTLRKPLRRFRKDIVNRHSLLPALQA